MNPTPMFRNMAKGQEFEAPLKDGGLTYEEIRDMDKRNKKHQLSLCLLFAGVIIVMVIAGSYFGQAWGAVVGVSGSIPVCQVIRYFTRSP